ncbi:MAG: KH domain-containing protein [Ruminococcaceae bacterium]|nr:KH domain-containing protein [Oscillospiraceae bacterium]
MEKIFTAKLLEDAKEQAYLEFEEQGADRDEVEITILEQPVKKLFGTKGEYKIKAEWNPVEVNIKEVFGTADEEEEKAEDSVSAPAVESAVSLPVDTADNDNGGDNDNDKDRALTCAKIQRATAYLTKVLTGLGLEGFTITPIKKGDTVILDIEGENLGVVIGRRGETLDSLQYLAILAGNRGEENYCRLSVDCCGYREKRRETLETLALKTARKVLKAGRRITLEPMNPYERRIIHSKVSEVEGVSSRSIGEEPFRKVVISANEPRRNGGGRRNNGDRQNRSYDTGSYRRSSGFSTSFEREYKRKEAPAMEPTEYSEETVELEKTTSLYGKIEL